MTLSSEAIERYLRIRPLPCGVAFVHDSFISSIGITCLLDLRTVPAEQEKIAVCVGSGVAIACCLSWVLSLMDFVLRS